PCGAPAEVPLPRGLPGAGLDADLLEDAGIAQRVLLDDVAGVVVVVVVDDDHLIARRRERLLLERVEKPAKAKPASMRRDDDADLRSGHGGHDTAPLSVRFELSPAVQTGAVQADPPAGRVAPPGEARRRDA